MTSRFPRRSVLGKRCPSERGWPCRGLRAGPGALSRCREALGQLSGLPVAVSSWVGAQRSGWSGWDPAGGCCAAVGAGEGGLWCGSQFFPNVVVCSRGESPLISVGGMLRAIQSIHGHLHNRLWFGLSLCWSCWPTRD